MSSCGAGRWKQKKEDLGGARLDFLVDFGDAEERFCRLENRRLSAEGRRRRTTGPELEQEVRRGIKVSDSEPGQLSLFSV